ncbi:PREDICTED: ubiquitin carboxyl-terminal hydrolase 20 isoform X1 [Nicrophorus vespilloides]|uniref:Ubiquitin carboxyl-terminal hydrolase n=1 Tax=Nicrophorus vespilloides TaxID=110193 RepID=A0ABM1N1M3_NICVS|nr:PREDICTED: ubiquitin carboxyl-terminal hydrolase 20 isoform X1 [Nicrophorus vespilloides]XP_017780724.1 PREDICTED: ubiquitin carboxyl-terminal hydrolase 20 isoform X1 [Nicrophorus vespilloides]
MSYRYACSHLTTVTDIPVAYLVNSNQKTCADCNAPGPNLWVCLYSNCLKVRCSRNMNNHSVMHNTENPSHCIHMNLSTQRVWCYKCQSEVFIESVQQSNQNRVVVNYQDSDDQDGDDCQVDSRDSGHGSYSTLQTNTPEHVILEKPVYLSGRMSADTSDSSDNEDKEDELEGKPDGLVGLQNIGNTCYMNAALQALSNTTQLTNFFLECPAAVHLLSEDRKPGLSRQYQALIRDMWIKKNGGYVTPSGILFGIRSVFAMFRGYHQHDTQEFLRNFMDQLHEELKQICPPECTLNDVENVCLVDEPTLSSNYESSEGEYETCDSGVSERSSLSDDTERPTTAKRRLSRSKSPRRTRARMHSNSVIDSQPSISNGQGSSSIGKRQLKYRSIISDIFDGKLLSSVQCLTCDRVSSRVETFQDLSLPIPSRDHLMVLHGRNIVPGVTCAETVLPIQDGWVTWIMSWLRSWFYGPTITLHDCLAAFFSTDELKGDNMYSCERCNKLRNGLKYSKVLQLPEVLCIHLKRFRHELMYSSKISLVVSFPLKGLDMRPYLHKDCISQVTVFELFSVICHHGTAGGGHYTCYALNNHQWYEFDDQCVTRVHPDVVQNCEAYVLFYRKVRTSQHGLKTKINELVEGNEEATGMDVAYVSKQWMSRFNTCAEPGPIDNSDFLCSHNAVNPQRSLAIEQLTTAIPKKLYDYLFKKYGGCAPITSIHLCAICQAIQRRITLEMETLRQLNIEFENQEEAPTHLLSSTWYSQWNNFVEKKTLDPPGPIDHTTKSTTEGGTEEYIDINEDIWNFFYGIYGGGPELLINPPQQQPLQPAQPQFAMNEDPLETNGFCKGEPMDTEEQTTVEENKEEPTENPVNHSSTSNTTLTTDEEPNASSKEECSNTKDVRSSNNRHRRRRRRDIN